ASTRPHNCTNPDCSDSGVISVTREVEGQVVDDEEASSDLILLPSEAPGEAILEGESKAAYLEALSRRQFSSITRAVGGMWIAQGPGPTRNGQVENISPNNEEVGAITPVQAHSTTSAR